MSPAYKQIATGPEHSKRPCYQAIFSRLVIFVVGILIGALLIRPRAILYALSPKCPATLPLEPILHHPLLPNDTHLEAAKKELSSRLHGKLKGTDSAVVIVVHGGKTILEWSQGRIRSNVSVNHDDRKVGPNTIWRVASITKVFTVLEALVQQNKGRLNIDDDIRHYIKEFNLFDNAGDKVTLRALGSHLSGLGRDILTADIKHLPGTDEPLEQGEIEINAPAFCDPGTSDRSNGTRVCTRADILRAIALRPLSFEPWTRPLYSNTGFNLLGWAAAQAAKRNTSTLEFEIPEPEIEAKKPTLEELLHEDVFAPLGMKDTSFWVPLDKRDDVAVPAKGVPNMIDWEFTSTFNPAGGMYTTANDLAKFVNQVLLSPNSTILTNQQVREWLAPLYVFADRKTAVGMPWEISLPSDLVAHPLFSKAGSHPGHTSHLVVSPELSFAVIALSCGPESDAGQLAFETERVMTPLMQKTLGKRTAQMYAGIYQQQCPKKKCSRCGEIVLEVDAEMKITRMVDCDGKDLFKKFDATCKDAGCFAKLWPVGREGEFRAQIIAKDNGCEEVWFRFEPLVVNGWPIDLVRIINGTLLYNPLGINAERVPMEDGENKVFEGKDGLLSWRNEAPLDMQW